MPLQRGSRLVVHVRDRWGERTLTLDFDDRGLLEGQLGAFERLRSRPIDRYHLHEFQNARGETIAFIEKIYDRHTVEDDTRR